ncbi:MAG: TonB-dependent receptor [Gammaproteobacteria bacterium]|nr:MAG: TonB-dependent receptor [Gammaproteobacteria bacterium]
MKMKGVVSGARWAAACCVLTGAGGVQAVMMDEVTVTATRVEQPIFDVPQSVTRMNRKQIVEGNYRTTPEALSHITGVTVQKTAHGQGSPFIRGLTGKQVLILVDGVRMNNSTFRFGPNQYLNTIDPALIERMEVVRGPGSVLYGSDALGGVINIITRKRQDFSKEQDTDAEANLVYGSADKEKTARGSVEGNWASSGYWFGGGYRDFDDLKGGDSVGTQEFTNYKEYHANMALSREFSNGGRVDLTFQQTRQMDVPRTDKFINSNEKQVFDPQERTAASLLWNSPVSSPLADRLSGSISFQRQHEELDRQKFSATLKRHNDDKVYTLGFNLQADTLLAERHLVTYGVEYYSDRVDSKRVDSDGGVNTKKPGTFPDDSEYLTSGIYLQDEYQLGTSSKIVAGVRYSYSRAQTDLKDFGFGNFDENYSDFTASLRWSGLIAEQMRMFAGVSQGFRAPNLDDLAVLRSTNEGIDVPSPNLDSEESINYELGLKLNKSAWQGTLTLFWSEFDDLIDRQRGTYKGLDFIDDNGNGVQDPGEDNVVQKFNVGEARIYGIEVDSSVALGSQWSLNGNISWAKGKNKTDKEPVSRIPPLRAYLAARWQQPGKRYWIEPFVELVDRQDRLSSRDERDPRIPDGGTRGYGTLNVRGGWDDGVQSLSISFNNMGDKAYKTHGSGVYGAGREIKLGYLRRF